MPTSRRDFIQTMGLGAVALPTGIAAAPAHVFAPAPAAAPPAATAETIAAHAARLDGVDPKTAARDEDFWYAVQQAYRQSPHFINLESGYYSPSPQEVMEAQIANIRAINETPSFYMRRKQEQDRVDVKRAFGAFAGADPSEFLICRNTTEALNTVIHGIRMEPGDEALMCDREYGSMLEAWSQRAARTGITLKIIQVPLVPASQDEIVRAYEEAIGPRTRVLLVSHMIYLTGQVLPVRAIADMAHARGIEVIVDAAHSFAHLDWKLPDLGADYLASSLHKWLGAPLGSGLLYVRKDKIAGLWPLLGDSRFASDDIAKLEHIGTHPRSTDLAIISAVRFHEAIGSKRKEERLRYLKNYWATKAAEIPGVTINTPLQDHMSCAIANVIVRGMTPGELVDRLWDDHRIFTVAVEQGARIAPNLWTRLEHLDALVDAIRSMA